LRDTDGTPIKIAQSKMLVTERSSIPFEFPPAKRRDRQEATAQP
jgi:hypothetical protein